MADTSLGQLAFVRETVVGVTPATPAFQLLDFTSETLKQSVTSTRSNSVSPNRVVKSSRITSRQADGAINIELVRGTGVSALLAALMANPFTSNVSKFGGSVVDTFTFERMISAAMYRRYTGVRIGSLDLNIQPEQIVTASFGVVGASMVTGVAPITGATYVPASTAEKLTSLDMTAINVSGITGTFDFEQITLKIENGLTASKRLGPNSTRKVRAGQAQVSGQARIYVDDNKFADAFVVDAAFGIEQQLAFAGVGYGFTIGTAKITGYDDANGGNGNEFIAAVDFEGVLDIATGTSLSVSQIG